MHAEKSLVSWIRTKMISSGQSKKVSAWATSTEITPLVDAATPQCSRGDKQT